MGSDRGWFSVLRGLLCVSIKFWSHLTRLFLYLRSGASPCLKPLSYKAGENVSYLTSQCMETSPLFLASSSGEVIVLVMYAYMWSRYLYMNEFFPSEVGHLMFVV